MGMARQLYELETTFRKHVDFCAEQLKLYLDIDLRAVMYPNAPDENCRSSQPDENYPTSTICD